MTETETKKKSLITPVSIISYPSLDMARKSEDSDGPPKFGAAFIFTADVLGTPAFKALQKRVVEVGAAALKKSEAEVVELLKKGLDNGGIRSPFRRNWEAKGYPEGSVYINARSTNRPGCVLADLTTVPPERVKEVFYAGARVKASVGAYYYDKKGNKGISFGLNNVQFIRDGERLDNRARPEEEFTADMSDAPDSMDDLLG